MALVLEAAFHREDYELLRDLNRWQKLVQSLRDHHSPLAKALDELLDPANPEGKTVRELAHTLVPTQYRKRGSLNRHLLAQYLGDSPGYQPRHILHSLLKELLPKAWPLPNPQQRCPCRPEWILALTPLPTLHRALLEMVERFWGLRLRGAVASLFLHGFLRDSRAQPDWPKLFREGPSLEGEPKKWGRKEGERLVERDSQRPVMVRSLNQELRVHLPHSLDQTLASPRLARLAPVRRCGWYQVVDRHLQGCLNGACDGHGWPFPQGEDYDWDLVEEYHEYVVGGPRASPRAHGGKP